MRVLAVRDEIRTDLSERGAELEAPRQRLRHPDLVLPRRIRGIIEVLGIARGVEHSVHETRAEAPFPIAVVDRHIRIFITSERDVEFPLALAERVARVVIDDLLARVAVLRLERVS